MIYGFEKACFVPIANAPFTQGDFTISYPSITPSTAPATSPEEPRVIVHEDNHMMRIVLNRPGVINSLDLEMIRSVQRALDDAEQSENIRLVLLMGNGEKGFCAGGNIKAIAQGLKHTDTHQLLRFFEEEYTLDLRIHGFPKPVIVIADGITMGGGLGLAAGADGPYDQVFPLLFRCGHKAWWHWWEFPNHGRSGAPAANHRQ